MRLIDADALIKTIRENDYLVVDYFNSKDRGMFTSGILQAIDEQPSAQPEPIRLRLDHELSKEEYERLKKDCAEQPIILLPKESAQQWIPCSERMPECEQEVLICTKKEIYISKNSGFEWLEEPIITPALYEDGTMLEVNSKWRWEDIDYAGWDEEEDCGIIPEGWWENRHFNPDDVYNSVVDREVVAWMPLPEPYKPDDFSQHMNPPIED